jgi:DNA-binding SARP family transcriptional activator/tetratricopeptide (TPR) repeat protein
MTERAHVDIRLLGPVAAFRDGEPGALGGPRQRAVLARLALVAGQVVTVDRLIDDVWSGDPPATATNTLQSYVSLLRRALGSADFVRRDGPGYVLDVDRSVLDAHRFEDAVTAATAAVGNDPATALELLDTALGEWRGPCLADVADEDWARAAAVRWEELRLTATEARFDALLALGRAAEAATGLERLSDEHPLREGFVRRLMLALYRSGRQAAALRAYSRTRALLADELGLDPTPELQSLERAILGHDPALAGPTPAATPPEPVPSAPGPDRPGLPLPGPAARAAATPLVGRERQLAALEAAWTEVGATAQPRLAVVVGEAGAGKTSVAARFAAAVHASGATVLWGRAGQEALVPFEALVQALRTALLAMPPRARQRVVGHRGPLAVLLPELLQLVPTLRAEVPPADVERYLLFETVAEMLATESDGRPILLVVDDVQWADGATIKLLGHVLRHERGGRVLVVATQRDPSEDPHPELDRLLMGLARNDELVRIPVGALDDEEVAELLVLAGHGADDAAGLRSATGGNAFFVSELIASGGDATTGALPDSVRSMIGARADRLPPAAGQLLALAAVAGPLSTLPVLVAASDLDADDVLDGADLAVAAGLLREDGAGRLVTPHALVRHAVMGRLTGARRQDLHRRIGAALRTSAGTEVSPAEVAHHLFAAGDLVDLTERLAAGVAAGEEAMARTSYEDAAAWAERSRPLAARLGPAEAAPVDLLESAARRQLGDRDAAEAAARRAANLAGTDALLLAHAAEAWVLSISGVGFSFGEGADRDLVRVLTTAIALLPDDVVDHQVWLRSMLVSVLVESGDVARQQQLSEEALAIARTTDEPGLLASALHARRMAMWRRDLLDERLPIALDAIDHARAAGDVHLELTAMLVAMSDLMESGRVDEQVTMLREFRDRAATLHSPLYDVYSNFLDSCRLLTVGAYDDAERVANAALAAGLSAHGTNTEMAHAGQMFCLVWDRGQLADVVDFVEITAAANPQLKIWTIALVGALAAAGRFDDARKPFEELVGAHGIDLPDDSLWFTGVCFLVEVAKALGDAVRAAILRDALEPYVGRVAITGFGGVGIGPVRRYVGVAAHVAGDPAAAVEHLELAVTESTRHGMRPFTARAHRDLAAALRDRGGPGDAAAAAEHDDLAAAIAAEIGLVLGPI